jgi:hypothetical protein
MSIIKHSVRHDAGMQSGGPGTCPKFAPQTIRIAFRSLRHGMQLSKERETIASVIRRGDFGAKVLLTVFRASFGIIKYYQLYIAI